MRDKFTDKELDILLKNLCVICDSREQEWSHIKDYFDNNKIKYRVEKLQQGDYSCCILSNEETIPIGITRDKYFDKDIVIERKACIDEIAGNMKEPDRTRLKKEFSYLKSRGTIIKFFVEEPLLDDELKKLKEEEKKEVLDFLEKFKKKNVNLAPMGFDMNIRAGNYRSQYKPKSLYASIKDFEAEFGFELRPVNKIVIGSEISFTLRYFVRSKLLGK